MKAVNDKPKLFPTTFNLLRHVIEGKQSVISSQGNYYENWIKKQTIFLT